MATKNKPLNRTMILAAIAAANGKKSRKQLAEELNVDTPQLGVAIKGVQKQYDELLAMDPNMPLTSMGGKTVQQVIQILHDRYGDKLSKLVFPEGRGKPKMELSTKLGLDDLEI